MSIFQPDATLGFSPLSQCIAFFVLFGLCGVNSLMVSRFARHIVGTIDRIYIFVFCFVSQAVLITTVLGVLGHLNYYLIVASLAAIFVFLRYVRARLRMRRRSLARSSGMKPQRFPSPFLGTPWTVLLGLAVLVMAVFLFVWAVVTPPPASDAFIYHLTLPVKWMHTGSIVPDRFGPFGESFHPSNPETLLLWLILPFHEDTFANLISWAFWFLCGLAVYSISVALRARHSDGVAAGMLWLALPLAARSAASSEVDLFAAFFLLVSVVFLLRYRAERHVVFLLWGGLSLGIYTGSKLIAFPFSLPVYALYAILIMERRHKRANHLAVFLTSSLFLSGFWYLSNFMLTGNPIHPVELSVFGHVIAPGEIHREAIVSSAAHTPRLVELLHVLDELFGVYLTNVLILTLAAAIFYAVWRRRFITSGVLLLPVVLTALFWLIGINKINSARYLFPAAALACVAWSLVARERKTIRLPLYFITLACVAMTLAGNRFLIYTVFRNLLHALAGTGGMEAIVSPARLLFLLASASGALLFMSFVTKPPLRRRCYLFAIVIALVVFTIQYPGLSRYYSVAKYQWYRAPVPGLGDAWSAVDKARPRPLNVAVAGTNLYHGFHGAGLRNRVSRFDWRYYKNDEKWIGFLQGERMQLLVVSRVHPDLRRTAYCDGDGFPMDAGVAERHPEVFGKFKDYGNVRIYVVYPPGNTGF